MHVKKKKKKGFMEVGDSFAPLSMSPSEFSFSAPGTLCRFFFFPPLVLKTDHLEGRRHLKDKTLKVQGLVLAL